MPSGRAEVRLAVRATRRAGPFLYADQDYPSAPHLTFSLLPLPLAVNASHVQHETVGVPPLRGDNTMATQYVQLELFPEEQQELK